MDSRQSVLHQMKKVLLITYYWPPAGGAGVQRVLKFAKYLPLYGWQPVILTVKNPDCPVVDNTLINDIPNECIIYKTSSLEPFELYKKFTGKSSSEKIPSDVLTNDKNQSLTERFSKWVRFNLFIPDAKIGWWFKAINEAENIIKKENIDIVFSTAPPPTTALIGKSIAKKFNLKWVADFRDPWLEIVHYQNVKRLGITKYIDSKLEKSVLRNADALVTISQDILDLLQSKVNNSKGYVIPNGYDESDFNYERKQVDNSFIIAYTGVITKTRVPYTFLKAVKTLIYSDGFTDIKIILAGNSCSEFNEEINNNKLTKFFVSKGFVPHHESTNILLSSSILLLVIDKVPNNMGFLTGKIFEYLGSKKPIFAVGPVQGEANKIINETNSGVMVDYNNFEETYNALKNMYYNWKEGKNPYTHNVEKYSRKKQTEELSKIFNKLII